MNKLLKAGLLLFLACIGTVQAQQKQDLGFGAEPLRFLSRRYGYPGEGDDVAT